jgi:hypothetical protein
VRIGSAVRDRFDCEPDARRIRPTKSVSESSYSAQVIRSRPGDSDCYRCVLGEKTETRRTPL